MRLALDVLIEIESAGIATGFALAETTGPGRAIAEDVLVHLVKKQPRTKIGKAARNKLELISA